jgi:formylglycine-generating enzyme
VNRTIFGVLTSAALLFPCAPTWAVTIEMVTVGNPGNAPDNNVQGRFGAVDYTYRIAAKEITNAQYVAFLNAKSSTLGLDLYNDPPSDEPMNGIYRTGMDGNLVYSVKSGMENMPVVYVNWFSAIRFVNWLNNGQGNGDTETGAYTIGPLIPNSGGQPVNPSAISRNANASWFLPNENEWYKAAYYDPRTAAESGPPGDDHYWLYPTKSDATPYSAKPPGDSAPIRSNTANFVLSDGVANGYNDGFAVTGSTFYGNSVYLTVSGTYPQSRSFYNTRDQGGNVSEWNETLISGNHGVRGGSWADGPSALAASGSRTSLYVGGDITIGFRVAAVPEPSGLALGASGAFGVYILARKRRR